jgi:hypothetical protein
MNEFCQSRFFRADLHHIAYIRFVVESYEGLALITSLPGRCEVEWVIPAGLVDQAEGLARALAEEVTLVSIDRPADWPDQADS